MDDPGSDVRDDRIAHAHMIEDKFRRLLALVAAAGDMAGTVRSQDDSLGYAQELLEAAEEMGPDITHALDILVALLSAPSQLRAA